MTKLEPYRGREVISTSVKITGAGDGLSEPLSLEPVVYDEGEIVDVLVRCKVDKHSYNRVMAKGEDTGVLTLVQSFKAQEMVVVPCELGETLIRDQSDRLAKAREVAEGTRRLQLESDLGAEHDRGEHDTFVENCPRCEDEAGPAGDDPDLQDLDDLHGDTPEDDVENHVLHPDGTTEVLDATDPDPGAEPDGFPMDRTAEFTDEDRAFMEAHTQ